jgi:GTPase SAR1 family protein
VKISFIGDDASGKTEILRTYCHGYSTAYKPCQFDSYNVFRIFFNRLHRPSCTLLTCVFLCEDRQQ